MKRSSSRLGFERIFSLFLVLLGVAIGPSACSDSGIVGGRCADGYTFCDPICVDTSTSIEHCGACNSRCDRGEVCDDGFCSSGSGGSGGTSSGGTGGLGGNGTGGLGGLGGMDGTGGDGTGGVIGCFPPYNRPRYCGDCSTRCLFPTPFCAPDGAGSYECISNCTTAPFDTECSESCVDTTSDADNCGGCGIQCPSGICVASDCVGATPGHLVALCHDYSLYFPNSSQSTLLGNAVFMAEQNPARILAYTQYASSATTSVANATLASQAGKRGRAYVLTNENNAADLATELKRSNYDVFLVYDQVSAPSGSLATIAANILVAVQTFTDQGGVVVVLTGGAGSSEMDDFISGLGIANVTGFTDQTTERLYLQSPGDGLAVGVVSPYLGVKASCSMTTTDVPTGQRVFVVSDTDPTMGLGEPVAIHNVIPP